MLVVTENETPADSQEYDELDLAERGESGIPNGGGTRKKKMSRKKKTRKFVGRRKTRRNYKKHTNKRK
jgi:hypothetical protein